MPGAGKEDTYDGHKIFAAVVGVVGAVMQSTEGGIRTSPKRQLFH